METTAPKNRLTQYWEDPAGEPVFTSGAMTYLSESMIWAVQLKMDELARRQADLEHREAEIRERMAKLEEQRGRRERLRTQISAQLQAAMTYCADFAREHPDRIVGAALGYADGRFRFVFLTDTADFDWELSDLLTELEGEMLERIPGLPVNCLLLPARGRSEDLAAILEVPMYTLQQGDAK